MALVTISIACYNNSSITKMCLDSIISHTPYVDKAISLVLSDNASTDDTLEVLSTYNNVNMKIVRYGINTGFGFPHNVALRQCDTEFFIALNNDMIIHDSEWLDKLLLPLEDPRIAITGFAGSPMTLRADGTGYIGTDLEYIEGSCICGRTEMFKEYGLFDPIYEPFIYEDSDMSLRYRQMGYKIKQVEVNFEHRHNSTLNTLARDKVARVVHKNKTIFINRWGRYLRNRKFSNKILVKMHSDGIGDILNFIPLLRSLRRDHPTADIIVDTNYPDLFINNPNFDGFFNRDYKDSRSFDRFIDLSPSNGLNYGSYETMFQMVERIACTEIRNPTPDLYPKREDLEIGYRMIKEAKEKFEIVVAYSPLMSRSSWQGRNWNIKEATKLAVLLREAGFGVVEIGSRVPPTGEAAVDLIGETTIFELCAVIANCDMFIGIDSFPFHIAQAWEKPSYVLFGATEPIARVLDFSNTRIIRNESLACVGCYQKKNSPGYNRCDLGYEACMHGISAEMVINYILDDTASQIANIAYLQERIRNKD